jgi:signal transduction histidine kinase
MRVVVACVALLAGGLAIAVFATRQVLLSNLDEEIESQLRQEVAELRRIPAGTDPDTGGGFGDDVAAIFDTFLAQSVPNEDEAFFTLVDGDPYAWSADPPHQLLENDELVASWRDSTTPAMGAAATPVGAVRFLVVPLVEGNDARGHFVTAIFPEARESDVHEAVYVLVVVSLLVLIAASVFAWTAAGRVVAPVRRLTSTARRISDTDMSARIPVTGDDELAELSATFNGMLDRLEQGFRNQREFLDDVAHELRTPITIVRGHLELLGDDPAERIETVELVTGELDRMSRYVNDLLLLARAEQRDFLDPGVLDFAELIDSVLVRASAIAPRRWRIENELRPGALVGIADETRLGQAMLNLAANAARHTHADDEIAIGAERRGDQVALWVRDSGPGIDPAIRDTLFARFSQAADVVRDDDSTGLGLAIVAAIARAHGGDVDVASQPGSGAVFTIVVPLSCESAGSLGGHS